MLRLAAVAGVAILPLIVVYVLHRHGLSFGAITAEYVVPSLALLAVVVAAETRIVPWTSVLRIALPIAAASIALGAAYQAGRTAEQEQHAAVLKDTNGRIEKLNRDLTVHKAKADAETERAADLALKLAATQGWSTECAKVCSTPKPVRAKINAIR